MKKIISLILCLIMVVGITPTIAFAKAKATKRVSGNYTYKILSDGTAEIVKYKDNKTKIGVLKIPSKLDGYKVTSIGKRAFKAADSCDFFNHDNYYLNDEEWIEGDYAWDTLGCDVEWKEDKIGVIRFRKIVIPNGVTKIGKYAFENCYKLKRIVIPNSVTKIGQGAFRGCCDLEKIKLPGKIKTIESYTFYRCLSLKTVKIPSSVTTIKNRAFKDCSISSITVPKTVTKIGEYAFDHCYNLYSAKVPFISDYMFSYCTDLEQINVTTNITKVNEGAFMGCSSLEILQLPKSVTSFEDRVFEECESFRCVLMGTPIKTSGDYTYIVLPDNTAEIIEYYYDSVKPRNLVIPDTLDGYKVTSIGNRAFGDPSPDFGGCSGKTLRSVVIPDGVTNIGDKAFSCCNNLKTVSIPNSVTRIGDQAFSYFGGKSFVIPESVTEFGFDIFYGSEKLEKITLPKNLKTISQRLLNGCVSLKSIEIPDSVTTIEEDAFSNSGLERVELSGNITSIGAGAFSNCDSLTTFELPSSITKVSEGMFSCCDSLTYVNIPNTVTEIEKEAFYYCSSLNTVALSDGLTKIGEGAFEYCQRLKEIEIPGSVTQIGKMAFYDCSALKTVKFSGGATKIGDYAFSECKRLENVTLSPECESIGKSAFSNCGSMKSIYIPKQTKVENYAVCSFGYLKDQQKGKDFKIYGYVNSDAFVYAMKHGIDFVDAQTQKLIKANRPGGIKAIRATIKPNGKDCVWALVKCTSIENADWYVLEYSYNKKMKNAETVTNNIYYKKTPRFEIYDLTPGKKLYIRVKVVNNKQGKFSKIFSIKLEK